ncbi:MAG: HTH domain-containing protein [Clostridia bacterium]|nr:HTH domain-containing protein [Clostridia bacterium]
MIETKNIFTYGLTEKEENILKKSLPKKDVDITDITDAATDIVSRSNFALIINLENITDDELQVFVDFYSDADDSTETIVFTSGEEWVLDKFKKVKTIVYKDLFEMEQKLKYDLLKAYQRTAKSNGYSDKLAMLIKILFAIRNKPYITTRELADKIERTDRTVQRYIETLRCAGEFIGYDRQKKGWYLMVDGKSVLMNEF